MRRWVARFVLSGTVLLIGLLAGELLARARLRPYADAQFDDTLALAPGFYRLVPNRGYAVLPNARPGINSLGMRMPERSPEKPPGALRVVVLGDSIAFGVGVEAEETFGAVAERVLRARSHGRAVEVFNLGVIGYNSEQEYHDLVERGLPLEPDAVVLGYCLNDVQTTPILFEEGGRVRFYLPGTSPALDCPLLIEHSVLYRVLLFQLERARAMRSGKWRPGAGLRFELLHDEPANLAALRRMAELLGERKIPFLVVVFPYLKGEFAKYEIADRRLHAEVAAILDGTAAGRIDLLEVWGRRPVSDFRRTDAPDDFVHPNAAAHLEVGRFVADWVISQGLMAAR